MSRYLELSVEGPCERVAERALRAFQNVGKVESYNLAGAVICGTIPVSGNEASVRISWHPGKKEGKVQVEIAAVSDDLLSQAADSALYAYASTYKAIGWPGSQRTQWERQQKIERLTRRFVPLLLGALVLGILLGPTDCQVIR
jgi:hypothetical protein